MLDPRKLEEYISSVAEKISSGQEKKLDQNERRLGKKMLEAKSTADKALEDLRLVQESIQRAHQRVEDLKNRHLEFYSKAAGFTESLLALKFGDQLEEKKKETKAVGNGNGTKDPSPPKKRKTQTKTARPSA
jgi:hypothetical protein